MAEADSAAAGALTDAESLTDRLVEMAVRGGREGDEDDDDDDDDFLSASDGESDEEKLREWGNTLPEPVGGDGVRSPPLQAADSSSGTRCDTGDSEAGGDEFRPLDSAGSEAAATAEGEREDGGGDDGGGDGGGDGDGGSGERGEKDDEAKEKEEDALERKRQEEEDALTEEERQTRLAEAVRVKVSGNEAFKLGQYGEATECYNRGLALCPLKYAQQRSVMLSNRAACLMKEEDYEEVVKDCSKAIDLQPTYVKAINRRAEAYEKLEKLDDALKDHQKILELDRSQGGSYHACLRLENEIKERNEKMKEEMMGKLKDLGNMVLRPFGLSTNNFQLQQDSSSGSYSVQFVQSPPSNGQ